MEKILTTWFASQNDATKAILEKVVAKKVFTITMREADKSKVFSLVEF